MRVSVGLNKGKKRFDLLVDEMSLNTLFVSLFGLDNIPIPRISMDGIVKSLWFIHLFVKTGPNDKPYVRRLG
jgi:hypothetical protein